MHLFCQSNVIAFSDSCKIRSLPATLKDGSTRLVQVVRAGQGNNEESRNARILHLRDLAEYNI